MIAPAKPARLTEGGRCSECGKLQVRFDTDLNGQLFEIQDPCAHLRQPGSRILPPRRQVSPERPSVPARADPLPQTQEEKVPRPKYSQYPADEVEAATRRLLEEDHKRTADSARVAVEKELGITISPSRFYKEAWRVVRAELGIRGAGKRAVRKGVAEAVAEADVQFSEAVHAPAVLLEVRSFRATYEAGEYIRLEEQDGEWVLSARMAFPDAEAARRALGRLVA